MAYQTAEGLWVPHAVSVLPVESFPSELVTPFKCYGVMVANVLQGDGESVESEPYLRPFIPCLRLLVTNRINEAVTDCSTCDGPRRAQLLGDTVGIGDLRGSSLQIACESSRAMVAKEEATDLERTCRAGHGAVAKAILKYMSIQSDALASSVCAADEAASRAEVARVRVMHILRTGTPVTHKSSVHDGVPASVA